uniref:Uncharacterized protein n=1 Tax=Rhizophora mucronata TaxID=61149 RepID=A0A2P2MRC0_RHIMU
MHPIKWLFQSSDESNANPSPAAHSSTLSTPFSPSCFLALYLSSTCRLGVSAKPNPIPTGVSKTNRKPQFFFFFFWS